MKKLFGFLLVLFLFVSIAYAGTISDELNAWWSSKTSLYDDPNEVKAQLQEACWGLNDQLAALKESYDAGKFDNFPTASKAKAIWIYQQLKTARDAIAADSDAMELLDWRP